MSSIGQKQTWEPSKSLKSGSSPRCFDRSPCLSGVVELLALHAKVVSRDFFYLKALRVLYSSHSSASGIIPYLKYSLLAIYLIVIPSLHVASFNF